MNSPSRSCLVVFLALACLSAKAEEDPAPTLDRDVLPLVKTRCVKCHGPIKHEGRLILSSAGSLAAGGESGPAIDRAAPMKSLLWQRIASDEMPPEEPLNSDERAVIQRWLAAGAIGLPAGAASADDAEHWAFRRLTSPRVPHVKAATNASNAIDRFVQAALEARGLSFSAEADRYSLIRRLSFCLTGLPPDPDDIDAFVNDAHADAYERLVERYLASPQYGVRWGRHWLDAAGYADSNGYFNADTDRPLAYRYRDYVVDAINRDKPFDEFIREQLAGDELVGYQPEGEVHPEQIGPLLATHFLRNSQDGTGESDGNADEVRADRYSVLEGTQQIIGSALLGLTLQCARCHDHKFEPVTQAEYYALQAILAPAFDPDNWIKPNDRLVVTASPAETAAWEARMRQVDESLADIKRQFAAWMRHNRPRGHVLWEDHFDSSDAFASQWSNTAPGDDAPAGSTPVALGAATGPAALVQNGALSLIESGGAGNRWLSTVESFDWAPTAEGDSIQVTFDLIADKVQATDQPAARIGYYIALCDYNDNAPVTGGDILIDGNPAGGAAIHVDYPGDDSRTAGTIGTSGYCPGHNYGLRITNAGDGRYLLEQLVDEMPEEKTVTLAKADLPSGGFGFEFCCGRSFIIDNVVIEHGSKADLSTPAASDYAAALAQKRKDLEAATARLNGQRTDRPGKAAVVLDRSPPADWFLLVRGNYGQRGEKVAPGVPHVLEDAENAYAVIPPTATSSTGRRLALACWLTHPNSRAAALLARVTVNRIWQQHFGTGICATPDNLGYSGAAPSHPELLEYLADEFVRSGWRMKALHRMIARSHAYRQSSQPRDDGLRLDPDNRLLWRFPIRRLDADSVRDAALTISGQLEATLGGRYVSTDRNAQGEVIVDESKPGSRRRSLYVQQRRTQVLTMLEVFDAPSIVTNCTRRSSATIPLQSLSALNSEFAVARARGLAERLASESPSEAVNRAFMLVAGRPPNALEQAASERFLATQPANYADRPDALKQALTDFCQMMLASNNFLYIE